MRPCTKCLSMKSLHRASTYGHVNCISLLIEKYNIDPNTENKYGKTPLHNASECGFIECMHELLRNNANADAQDIDGNTPLHHASIKYANCVALLMANGANSELQNKLCDTPYVLALKYNHIEGALNMLYFNIQFC